MNGTLVAMSGGVDSSAAAYLVKSLDEARGRKCAGATMKLFLNGDIGIDPRRPCCSQKDIEDAANVARKIGIPHEIFDCMVDFKLNVIDRFIESYETGATPNPCIDCNRYIKFGAFLDRARSIGFDRIATGHYARIERDENTGRFLLKKGIDPERDQSYVLYAMTQDQLAHTVFPLGGMTKSEVRKLAETNGFTNARKRDSQDICFVPDGDYASFIERYTGKASSPGDFIDETGRVIGRHKGVIHYTLGQRRGLGIPAESRLYISHIDAASNKITLSPEKPLCRSIMARDVNLISLSSIDRPARLSVKVRYRQPPIPATVTMDGDMLKITFDDYQTAPAAGQAAVLYDGDIVAGGGTISDVEFK